MAHSAVGHVARKGVVASVGLLLLCAMGALRPHFETLPALSHQLKELFYCAGTDIQTLCAHGPQRGHPRFGCHLLHCIAIAGAVVVLLCSTHLFLVLPAFVVYWDAK